MPRHVFTTAERRKGGRALVDKRGSEYMAEIGSRGFWAMMSSLAERQEVKTPFHFRGVLDKLKAKKGG